jgi:predicted transcriptional regulator
MKSKKSIKKEKTYKLDELTAERIGEIGKYLEYSATEVIELLVSQYFKMQTIKHEDDDGLKAIEYIPFFESKETYKQFKDSYFDENGFEYSPKMMTRENI